MHMTRASVAAGRAKKTKPTWKAEFSPGHFTRQGALAGMRGPKGWLTQRHHCPGGGGGGGGAPGGTLIGPAPGPPGPRGPAGLCPGPGPRMLMVSSRPLA